MSDAKPDDIPEDVWAKAGALWGYEARIGVARAILAERDRCAKIAEGFEQTRDWVPGSLYDTMRREVAAAIRQER